MVPTGSLSRMSTRDSGDCAAMRVTSELDEASHALPAAARRSRLRLPVWFGFSIILFGLHLQDGQRIGRERARKAGSQTVHTGGHRHNFRGLGDGVVIGRTGRAQRYRLSLGVDARQPAELDRKSTRLNS